MFGRRFANTPQREEIKPRENKDKSCKRIIKRDEHGRIKSEEFIGCTKEEVRIMRGSEDNEEEY